MERCLCSTHPLERVASGHLSYLLALAVADLVLCIRALVPSERTCSHRGGVLISACTDRADLAPELASSVAIHGSDKQACLGRDVGGLVVCQQGPPPPNPLVVERFQQVISQLFQQACAHTQDLAGYQPGWTGSCGLPRARRQRCQQVILQLLHRVCARAQALL